MSRTIISLLALIVLVLMFIFCIQKHTIEIQEDIKKRTISALSVANGDWVTVNVDGRYVELTGIAPSKFLKEEVNIVALEVYGVAAVDNQIILTNETTSVGSLTRSTPYLSQLIKNSSGIILSGLAPDEEKHMLLFNYAEKQFGTGNVTDWMEIAEGAPEGWQQAAIAALLNLTLFSEGTADLIGTQINLFGRIIDNQAKKTLEEKIKNSFPNNFRVDLDLIKTQATAEENHLEVQRRELSKSCNEQYEDKIGSQTISFLTRSTSLELNDQAESVLTNISDFLNKCPNSIIEVSGHTDTRGSELYNLRLSKKRAQEIINKLVEQGVQSDRLRATGYGEAYPLTEDITDRGKAMNRRIEFTLIQNGNKS